MDDCNRLMGNPTEGEEIGLIHKAFDPGIILFDAADTDAYKSSRLLTVIGEPSAMKAERGG
jgi:aryl-alcohol dehydrogenase-like predicted oxidoreductase